MVSRVAKLVRILKRKPRVGHKPTQYFIQLAAFITRLYLMDGAGLTHVVGRGKEHKNLPRKYYVNLRIGCNAAGYHLFYAVGQPVIP